VYSQDVVPIEDEHQPEQSERGVHAQPKHGVPSVQKGRPVLGLVPKDEFADAVYMHTLNGKSVRAIARLLNCSPTKVQNAKKKLEEEGRIATSSSA
jgi:DNA invertase Pin-like site-specific DNA recombinase